MNIYDIAQVFLFILCLTILSPLLGSYIDIVLNNKNTKAAKLNNTISELLYKFFKIDAKSEMNWKTYTLNLLGFSLISIVLLILIQMNQAYLPGNPAKLPNVSFYLALNTAISFVTNTNWQAYPGETTLSYFTQMAGLTVQNFLSAAAGIAVLIALARGIAKKQSETMGNFWSDLIKSVIFILLPLSILLSIILISQGGVQSFSAYKEITTIEGVRQVIPLGPASSQIAIKQIGTNGGGFFNANSSFPFENPTPLTNFLFMLFLVLIPSALIFTYGRIINSRKQAWMIYGVMMFLLTIGFVTSYVSEISANNVLQISGVMEGKETRFGIMNSVLYSTLTTAASNGSVNAMHSSLSPIAGMVAMVNMMLGEIIFGGVGSGLYGMILFIILTVFISGLMIGRTPEYMGKKIEAFEITWSIIALIIPGLVILLFTAVSLMVKSGYSNILNAGPHGYSEILYAYSSAAGNNGSSFAGLNANTPFYNILTGIAMLIGRFGVIIPVMAISGSLVKKKITPISPGTLATDNFIFSFLLMSVIIVVGALTFFPAISLGPILEHLLMNLGISF